MSPLAPVRAAGLVMRAAGHIVRDAGVVVRTAGLVLGAIGLLAACVAPPGELQSRNPATAVAPAPAPVASTTEGSVASRVAPSTAPGRPAAPSSAPTVFPALPAGDSTNYVVLPEMRRSYTLHLPTGYDPAKAYPLLIVLHGRGGSGAGARQWGFNQSADQRGWVVIYPEALAPDRSWSTSLGATSSTAHDVAYIAALMKDVRERIHLDPERINAVGYSTGGSFAAHLAGALRTTSIAAVVVVAGNIATRDSSGELVSVRLPTHPVAALFLHGRLDKAAPFEGGVSTLLGGARAIPVYDGARLWATSVGCDPDPALVRVGTIDQRRFVNCKRGVRVEMESHSGGHDWQRSLLFDPRRPTQTIDHIMDFLTHSRVTATN